MEKIASLRAALVAPAGHKALRDNPDRLKIFVDKGRLVSRYTPKLSYQYRYTVRLFFEAYDGSPDLIMVPLLFWLRKHQPDLLLRFEKEDQAIQFAADILDEKSWDVAITFELQESVKLTARADGSGWDVVRLPEPSPDDPPLIPELATPTGIVPLEELWFGGSRILP